MDRKSIVTLLVWICGTLFCHAQHVHDIVYLNNGNVIYGVILKHTDAQVEIKTSNGETYSYPMVEVRKIEKGIMASEKRGGRSSKPIFKEYRELDAEYWSAVDFSFGNTIHLSEKNMQHVELNWINGYRFNEFLKVGAGFGARYYINNQDMRSSSIRWAFPVFADFRGNFMPQTSRSVVPYWAFDIGGIIRDGFMLSPTVGLRIGEKRSCLLLGVNYTGQTMKLCGEGRHFENVVSLKIGYEF